MRTYTQMDTRVTQVVDEVRRRLTDEFEQHQARAREREHVMQVQYSTVQYICLPLIRNPQMHMSPLAVPTILRVRM